MDDTISRQAAIDAIEQLVIPEDMCVFEILSHIELAIGALPSAQPEIKTDRDTISRAEAIEALARMMPRSYTPDGSHPADEEIFRAQEIYVDCIETLEILPSAQPEPKTGHWITKLENHTYECSECGNGIITNKDYLKKHKFCFCCGAKMRKDGEG